MLTKKQIEEIKEHLDKAQNPLFFFDNDSDGLCSFLLLQRYIERGKGVPIRSFPGLTKEYFRKVHELNADYIFILDKPEVTEEFFKEVEQVNIPVVWIDHHAIDIKKVPEFVNYYNPYLNEPKGYEPVTYVCYQVTQKKEDLWLAVVGCISDKFVPDFYQDFKKNNPELAINSENAFGILYKSDIGKIARIFGFALKDRTTNVINMIRFLTNVKTPHEVLEESSKNYIMHKRFNEIDKKYKGLLEKADKTIDSGNLLFFQYSGDLSISSDLSNELSYKYPKKVVVVIYIKGVKANISVRGKNIRDIILKAIEELEGATGGGHEDAVGVQVKVEDLEKFRKTLKKLVK
ncbi:DHH family protein [archaeon BMS3Abin17]|nr:DHH family protein [archaeon BMS3Abin17]HDZ60623.1 DHH family phosphoesterase [Candidatus Pacearchaeota archaeon]